MVLIPGVGGDSSAGYVNAAAAKFLERGYVVVVSTVLLFPCFLSVFIHTRTAVAQHSLH